MRYAGEVLHFSCATPPPHSWKRRAAPRSQPVAARGQPSSGAGLPQQPRTQPASTAEPTAAPPAAQQSARRGKKKERRKEGGSGHTAPQASQTPTATATYSTLSVTLCACASLGRLAHAFCAGAVSIAAEINRQSAARGLAPRALERLSARRARRAPPRLDRHERAGGGGDRLPEVRDQEAPGQGGECPGCPWELGEPGGGV